MRKTDFPKFDKTSAGNSLQKVEELNSKEVDITA